ncbi:MAG TPA: DivIVA domain-containing protein [Dermatophilaceae bacterium]
MSSEDYPNADFAVPRYKVMRPPERIDRGDYMAFMPEDVLNKNFTATQFRRGYDEHEVDDFLDEIVVELRRLTSENEDLSKQLKTCLEDKGAIPSGAKEQVAAARQFAEQAEKDAAARIAKAKADAEQAEAQAAERVKAEKESGVRIARANADAERAEALAGERKKAAEESASQIAKAALAVPAAAKEQARTPAEASGAGGTGLGSAAGVLALAERLHAEYVSEGNETRERLISEGQLRHDQVVGEATAKQEELRYTAQAKHDALIAEATSRHEQMITEARERAAGMVAEAQQKRAEVLQTLGHERSVLQQKIDELRIFERDYRARLKSHLEGQLHELERTGGETATNGEGAARG